LRIIPDGMRIPVLSGCNRGRRFIKGYGPDGYWLGIVERRMQKVVADNVRRGDVVYDIGANFGLYTLLLSKLAGKSGHVFAFEPAPRVVAGLRAHLELNKIQNVTVVQKAIAGREGEMQFRSGEGACVGHLDEDGDLTVPTVTLDLVANELPPPSAIKMDIEGAEVEALGAASECFRRYRPKLFLATHFDASARCCDILRSWGYRVRIVDADDLFAFHCGC
jgi:FkbM family methyltransferase